MIYLFKYLYTALSNASQGFFNIYKATLSQFTQKLGNAGVTPLITV